MLNVHVVAFPLGSVAVYVTVVLPIGNVAPGICDPMGVTGPELSVAVGAVHVAMAHRT